MISIYHLLKRQLNISLNIIKMGINDQALRSSHKFDLATKYKGWENNLWIDYVTLAVKNKAVNLGQGFADFKVLPDTMLSAFSDQSIMNNPTIHQYTRGFGHMRLVNAIANMYSLKLNHALDPLNNVLVTVGAYGSLFFAIQGLINQGDEVIIIEPFFDCYQPMVKIAGGECKFVPLRPQPPISGKNLSSSQWQLNYEELESKINSRTKALILNTPNNPLGKVYTESELQKIAALCQKHNIVVISDEVYEWIIYDDNKHISIASLPGMWERTLTIGSVGKTFNATGFKVGWTIGPDNLLYNSRVVSQNSLYTCPTLMQEISAIGFEHEMPSLNKPESYFNKISMMLLKKRNTICSILNDTGMKAFVPEGGYFVMVDINEFQRLVPDYKPQPDYNSSNKECKDVKFVKWLCNEKKLATIPCSAFYSDDHKDIGENYIRFCFIKKDETLDQAETIIKSLKT